ITHATIVELSGLLEPGDILIDGGNSFFQDDVRHAEMLNAKRIRYLDVGTSGGVWGLERGYCMMIGGDKDAAEHLDPIFAALAPRQRGLVLAARPDGDRAGRRCRPQRVFRTRRGFRRGALDDPGGDRAGGSSRGVVRGALYPVSLASGPYLRRAHSIGDAQA